MRQDADEIWKPEIKMSGFNVIPLAKSYLLLKRKDGVFSYSVLYSMDLHNSKLIQLTSRNSGIGKGILLKFSDFSAIRFAQPSKKFGWWIQVILNLGHLAGFPA